MNRAAASVSPRVALVTGGAQGIGRAIASRLAADGMIVLIADRDAPGSETLAASLQQQGSRAHALAMDVGNPASIAAVFNDIERNHGRCDVLVNNAGMAGARPFMDYPLELWSQVLAVNLTGPLLCGQRAAALMARAGWGRIVNIASISGVRASPGRSAYGASKAALIALTRQMAVELAPLGITANCVAPGPIETPLTRDHHTPQTRQSYYRSVPQRRYGEPEEIASAVAFLASDGAAYVNGHTLAVDGGFLAAGFLET
ncbi:SDR family NAD(P)-dependent oxidoreductase [Achromobacter agilis]|uniref:3-oxoacyl-[acyl-carrier-protein] reductase FabG n=1 Tax=Achromobacter agilis TaxID=1353888 RepID=A0A446C513_9BURK|nr:SDR family NAD(P)-dependent oxidoreductase [Achromobacter agilis]SSW62955.1 3-oxoacyl-[acyl-carrier-protein] reductase FabG [Achromobacter agilis]